ncbi:MAG: hypothetical protein DME97_04470 [Verrucomicrobia bacterium]|nr:MAG: hypothetical protein DME97_04470 [Verrucomicrobiota bacterium]
MALSFAIAAEGKTDQRVIENILVGFFRRIAPDIVVDWDHPAYQSAKPDKSDSWGNWLNVLEYLRRRSYEDAFQFHEYLVVQIDTDCAAEPGFDVPSAIEKFLFAICVDSVECWLLPLHCPEKAGDESNCLFKVNACLAKSRQEILRKNHVPSYANASAPYRREKTIRAEGPKQLSLARFLELLEAIKPVPPVKS